MKLIKLLILGLFGAGITVMGNEVWLLSLDGSVNPVSSDYLQRSLTQAERAQAQLVIIRLNTPGGLDSATQDIVQAILGLSVPVVVWVGPAGARAASAGTFILLSAHVAAMAPGTSVGAAHPIAISGETPKDDPITKKMVNDAASRIRSIAELRGRNPDWAERAVRESATATATEALALGIIDIIADSIPDLLAKLAGFSLPDGRILHPQGSPVREIRMTFRDRLLSYLADPNLVYILLMLGLYGLIYEFFTPGIGLGFVMGGISLLLALLGLQILPIDFVGVGLVLFGLLLIVLDAFTPTTGILTTGGVISLIIGSFSLFEIESPVIGLRWSTVAATVGTLTLLFVFVISKGFLAQRRAPSPLTTVAGLTGVAKEDLAPQGWVLVKGEYWLARAEGEPIHAGDAVKVVRQEGRYLIVRRHR